MPVIIFFYRLLVIIFLVLLDVVRFIQQLIRYALGIYDDDDLMLAIHNQKKLMQTLDKLIQNQQKLARTQDELIDCVMYLNSEVNKLKRKKTKRRAIQWNKIDSNKGE